MKNPVHDVLFAQSLNNTFTTATTVNGAAVDTRGYQQFCAIITFGDVTSAGANITVKLQSDDNSGFSSATDITGATTGAINPTDNTTRVIYGQVNGLLAGGSERYIRATATTASTDTYPVGVVIALYGGPLNPVPATAYAQAVAV